MAAETFKQIKCSVFRADYPDDLTDIPVNFNAYPTFRIQPGKEVTIPQPVYEILKNATYPAPRRIEDANGAVRTEMYDRPRFSISISDIETNDDANKRIAELALQQGKKIDDLTAENERLQQDLAASKADEVIPNAEDDTDDE